ncbi:hypothetical protein J4E91_009666 [Alternaria rosae]|nr:hypothetical protein J4E91_009666 [Alternaria rosae]
MLRVSSLAALVDRGRIVPWPRTRDAEASNDVISREKGVPWTPKRGKVMPWIPKRDAEAIKINSPGGHQREAEPIKRSFNFIEGGPDTDGIAISNEALTERGHNVPWGSKRAAEPANDLVERDRGSRWGGKSKRGLTPGHGGSRRCEAEPMKFKSSSNHRREAGTIRRFLKNPGGGNVDDAELTKLGSPGGHRREAEPAR